MARQSGRSRRRRRAGALWTAGGPAWLAACEGQQSALSAGGSNAAAILDLSMVLFIGAGVIFLAVMALAGYAVFARPDRFPGARAWVIGGGILFPVVTLTALQVYEFTVARRLAAQGSADMLRVEVTGRMWWWDVRYRDGPAPLRTANEIVIPAGRPVEFVVEAADVIHSFWVPSLAGKIDMIPGHTNRLVLVGETPGVYRGQCAEYCGAQHALMAFDVIVEPPDRFEAWLAAQRQPAPEPADATLAAGRDSFLKLGCGACHTVRGTAAAGLLGPDLTHVGGRRRLAAGTMPNDTDAFAAWIAGAQHVKPENRMPSFPILDGADLRAVAAWLESLS
ncbi:cytochrome c oxidase subunit II [Azospirillum rugosum]|uniref:Cytochrome aa3 subunit 2 n=1 Tax=Azospirillum rugosum TaxID=416170 RepID=A0ABS4SR33_9PROT|nr:cytochrome c oxidase subunit II [Azospirillum rugosum]MBP2295010.1 cytochrome c oxidase subunit 2 [Azospirillum rugosum]MDQ0528833.1 cytochrome c oxidase subunit 2 [Azospirillum rugosum]